MALSTTEKARNAAERLKPGEHELTPAAKTIAAAATAAIAGGLAAALKALVEHRNGDDEQQQQQQQRADAQQRDGDGEREQAQDQEPAQEETSRAPESAQADDPEASGDDDERDERESQSQPEQSEEGSGRQQSPAGGTAKIVEAGKSELEALLGQQVESISGLSRSDDGWCVTYEVVEMRRIPDSSDVMSSYAVVLDDDGDLMTFERKHRYRRAQVDDG
jgi:hypothetical protein